MGTDTVRLQEDLRSKLFFAKQYGLQPNWDKTIHLQVQHEDEVYAPS